MFKPWLWLPPKIAHDLGLYGLKLLSRIPAGSDNPKSCSWSSSSFQQLHFHNPLGIAGGVDKNGETVLAWQSFGCGFIEIGTVTPLPQGPNPGKIIDRNSQTLSLWNKMGFPSEGSDVVLKNIEALKRSGKIKIPLFINLGKNRTTSNENAHLDYTKLMTHFQNVADAFVVNISSPNTSGLRDLAKLESFEPFIQALTEHHKNLSNRPALLLKLSPDLPESNFEFVLRTCLKYDIDGFILTNTTTSRDLTPFFPKEGGVSGAPLKNLSLKALEIAVKICSLEKSKKIIISTGGVMTAADVFERIDKGADLVQVYSTLIFEGPGFFRKVAQVAKQREQTSRSKNFGSSEASSR
ncbi:MAG: quinone-dependent dihydroorotate dehydrogenase [Bdellovibrionaceae bacterium]|nr:quinone-dependent dihydroorotate dehydrogenase [Pseudobdellovibrionaceae bacterium]